MRILVKWYFNELLGYLIMSFTSIPVIANDKNKPGCIIFYLLKVFFNVETAIKRKKRFYFQIIQFQQNCMLVTYITERNGRKTDRGEFKITVSLLF